MRAPDWLTARPVAHRGLHDIARGIVEARLLERPLRGQCGVFHHSGVIHVTQRLRRDRRHRALPVWGVDVGKINLLEQLAGGVA